MIFLPVNFVSQVKIFSELSGVKATGEVGRFGFVSLQGLFLHCISGEVDFHLEWRHPISKLVKHEITKHFNAICKNLM